MFKNIDLLNEILENILHKGYVLEGLRPNGIVLVNHNTCNSVGITSISDFTYICDGTNEITTYIANIYGFELDEIGGIAIYDTTN